MDRDSGIARRLLWKVRRTIADWRMGSYGRKLANEQRFFNDCSAVHELPEIFHYWSNKYLLPKHQPFGIDNPDQLFFKTVMDQIADASDQTVRILSIGAGSCDLERRIASQLRDQGRSNFQIECMDINQTQLERGMAQARTSGVEGHLSVQRADFNQWVPAADGIYDVIMANQCLHHVLELEHLFASIKRGMKETAAFVTSDMIGRNGHQRWPEALDGLLPFWEELPISYRYNQVQQRSEPEYFDHDCSEEVFEGVRAQDILPLLVENFHFELFIPFANIVLVFIDRPFGHNFDVDRAWDRDFIDRVHARDEAAILSGEWKPTQMMAVMRKTPCADTHLIHPDLTPKFCIRHPG